MSIYGIKDCANLTLFDKATNEPALFSDYANVSTNEWTSERVYANAKGVRSIAWDYDRQSTLQVEMEVFDLKWIALVAGSDIKNGENEVAKREVVYVGQDKKAKLSGSPIKGSVQVVPVSPADLTVHTGEPLTEYQVTYTVDPDTGDQVQNPIEIGANEFLAEGNEITFGADVPEGTAFAVYYLVLDSDVRTIEISSDKFPKNYRIIADALIRERETGKDEFVQIEYPNAKPQSNFTITMSANEATTLSVTFDLFPNKDKAIATYKIIAD